LRLTAGELKQHLPKLPDLTADAVILYDKGILSEVLYIIKKHISNKRDR